MEKADSEKGGILRTFSWFLPLRPCAFPEMAPRILAVVQDESDSLLLDRVSRQSGWALGLAETPCALAGNIPAVILYDCRLAPPSWREIVGAWAVRSPRPYIILLSPHTDTNLWDELQRAGASDILRLPLERGLLVRAVERAWRVWYSEQRVRAPGRR